MNMNVLSTRCIQNKNGSSSKGSSIFRAFQRLVTTDSNTLLRQLESPPNGKIVFHGLASLVFFKVWRGQAINGGCEDVAHSSPVSEPLTKASGPSGPTS